MKKYLAKYQTLRIIWRRIRRINHGFRILNDYAYDWKRYTKWWHGVGIDKHQGQRRRALLKAYHGIEKGLSLQEVRPGFGQEKIKHLTRQIDEWERAYGLNDVASDAVAALRAYQKCNASHEIHIDWLDDWLRSKPETERSGGTKPTTKAEILSATSGTNAAFFASRYSMRQFSSDPVPMAGIRAAIQMAQKTPSVCNRQGTHAYCFEEAMDALQYQPGNNGFGHLASKALVITADLQAFSGAGERNQAWIDGGMFAMSVLYSLHALGYGACPLAWSQKAKDDKRVREALKIPESEVIIMMIAVGTLPEEFEVAVSQRISLNQVLIERTAQ